MKKIIDKKQKNLGFTIIELIVVIVVIGILAAISFVAYSGVVNTAITASLKSDLDSNADLLELYYAEHNGVYPSSLDANNCPSTPVADTTVCLKASTGNEIIYNGGGQSFTIIEVHTASGLTYQINENGELIALASNIIKTYLQTWGGTLDDVSYAIIQTSDGGYAISGVTASYGAGNSDVFIVKYASDGTLSWNKTWGGAGEDIGFSIIQTSDGGYAIIGVTASYGAGNSDVFILKYTSDGTLSWNKTWGGAGEDATSSIIQTSDGGYAITGETHSYGAGNSDVFIVKYASDGTLSWNKTWGGAGEDIGFSIIQTSDGGYAIAGKTHSYGADDGDAFIAKYTSDGTLSWNKTWVGVGYDTANSIIQTSDGGYAINGTTTSYGSGSFDTFIAKYTSDGTLSWNKTWGGADFDNAKSIIQTSDGGYAIAGGTYASGNYDTFIAKYTSDGTLSWNKVWDGEGDETTSSIIQTSDGGYAITGETNSYGSGGFDTFIAKYNSYGKIYDCPASICKSPTASVSSPTASVSSPTASVSSPTATTTSIVPVVPPPPPPSMTITFSSQEMYVAWPGDDQTVCKQWTVPGGSTIKGFMVSQETEEDYDFFKVSSDGVEKYNKSGYITDEYVNISTTPGTTLSACMSADESYQDGYGGEVTGVLYD